MKTTIFPFLVIIFCCLLSIGSMAQDRVDQIKNQLELLAVDNAGLDNTVEASVNGISLQEFIRSIANTNNLNISVEKGLDVQIVNNFSDVSVADVLVFLVKKYQLDIDFIGNIMSISKYQELEQVAEPVAEIRISYNQSNDLLSLDLQNDDLQKVAKKITDLSGKNVILSPQIVNKQVRAYIKNVSFDNALEKFAYANKMELEKTDDGFYLLTEVVTETAGQNQTNRGSRFNRNRTPGLLIKTAGKQNISIEAENAPVDEIVKALVSELRLNYYLHGDLTGNKTLQMEGASVDEILVKLFESTPFTYREDNGIYLIGERKAEGLRKTTVYQLQNRSIVDLVNFIPGDLKKEVELTEFTDLNSLVISGSAPQTNELISFLEKIDQIVPVVSIDVIIVDYRKNRSVTTGISAGLGTTPSGPTQGTIIPDANFSFSASSLNNIIGNINAGSSINLGKVTPNFYLSIQALETDGILRVRSTPKLATLNGSEATLSIGNTEYYIEESNNVIGSQNPQNIITRIYKPVNADLSVTIKPIVSGNDQITLEISVEQSDFTERISNEAPPGSVTRSFTSKLRVKNNEIILLGGLEEKSRNNSGSGLPFIARIPVLRWIFGKRTKSKSNTQLNIFIKPTVIY